MRSPEEEEHARQVKEACERVWNRPGIMRANGLTPWLDGKDRPHGGYMLPLERKPDDG